MRRLSILTLAICGLATSTLWAQGPPAPVPRHGKPIKIFKVNATTSSDNIPEKTFSVTGGWNLTKDEAVANALEKAREQVDSYLREQKPSLEWTPSVLFIRNRLLVDLGIDEVEKVIGEEHKAKLEAILIEGRFRAVEETLEVNQPERETKRVWLKVAINSDSWKQIEKENRRAVDQKRVKIMRDRMVFLVKFLAGIVVVLVTICGYVRLDEWSKGYYTKWLRLAALSCVGAVTAVLWALLTK